MSKHIENNLDKEWVIKVKCSQCGKEFYSTKYQMRNSKSGHIFCCKECYWKYKRDHPIKYESTCKNTKCDNCGKDITLPPNRFKHINRFGENHNFCCQKCYWEYRKKYYVGDKLYNTGTHISDTAKDKLRQYTVTQYANGCFDRQTKPQRIVNSILDTLNIKYTNEYNLKYYSIDNYIDDSGLMIEVMGDYFHANPLLFNCEKLNDIQNKDVIRDKRKHTYVKRYRKVEILYIWELDTKKNQDVCKKLIEEYIKNDDVLPNYHSFNYHIENDTLKLNDTIINPYFIRTRNDSAAA